MDQAEAQKAAEKKGHQDVVKSVNAGGFLRKNDTQSQIEARRNNAKKQALKVVSDAWKSDNKSADSIADMEGLKQSKVSEMNEIRAKMKDIENTKKSLQEEYGVADGSQEQKDLELLEKYQKNMNGSSYDQFSDEELSISLDFNCSNVASEIDAVSALTSNCLRSASTLTCPFMLFKFRTFFWYSVSGAFCSSFNLESSSSENWS